MPTPFLFFLQAPLPESTIGYKWLGLAGFGDIPSQFTMLPQFLAVELQLDFGISNSAAKNPPQQVDRT
jgi:hypothetical protein